HARPPRAPAHGLLPAARGGGPDDRADRDRDQGDARQLRSGGEDDPRRGEGGPGEAPQRTVLDAGPPPRRGTRREAARRAAAVASGRCASSAASSRRAPSTWATTSGPSASTWRARTAGTRSTASST